MADDRDELVEAYREALTAAYQQLSRLLAPPEPLKNAFSDESNHLIDLADHSAKVAQTRGAGVFWQRAGASLFVWRDAATSGIAREVVIGPSGASAFDELNKIVAAASGQLTECAAQALPVIAEHIDYHGQAWICGLPADDWAGPLAVAVWDPIREWISSDTSRALTTAVTATRMAAIGRVLSERVLKVEHNLRNQLTVVELAAGTYSADLPEGLRQEVEGLADAARLIGEWAGGLLLPRGSTEWETVDALELASELASAAAKDALPEGVAFEVVGEPGLRVNVARHELAQVFYNLIRNTAKHARCTQCTVIVRKLGHWVEFVVSDNGQGMSADRVRGLLHGSGKIGTDGRRHGVGLPSSRVTVEEHGGKLSVHSVIGRGTDFSIILPLVEEDGHDPRGLARALSVAEEADPNTHPGG